METRTANGEHNGWPWSIAITKSDFGTYTAVAEVSCQMHNVTLEFPDQSTGKKGLAKSPIDAGSYLSTNPYKWITEFIEGFIDGRNDNVSQLLQQGKKDALNELITIGSDNMRPMTKANDKQLTAMKEEVDRLISTFGATGVAHLVQVSEGKQGKVTVDAVRKWGQRGRISATMAHKLCKLDVVKDAGFTRESLRPDVKSWIELDLPIAQ